MKQIAQIHLSLSRFNFSPSSTVCVTRSHDSLFESPRRNSGGSSSPRSDTVGFEELWAGDSLSTTINNNVIYLKYINSSALTKPWKWLWTLGKLITKHLDNIVYFCFYVLMWGALYFTSGKWVGGYQWIDYFNLRVIELLLSKWKILTYLVNIASQLCNCFHIKDLL